MVGIYKITNKLNGKSYIGQSIHCGKRLDEHCKGKLFIDEIIQLEGIENFNFEILKQVSKDELAYWEDFYIKKYSTMYPDGYNKRWNCSKEVRNKIKTEQKENLTITEHPWDKEALSQEEIRKINRWNKRFSKKYMGENWIGDLVSFKKFKYLKRKNQENRDKIKIKFPLIYTTEDFFTYTEWSFYKSLKDLIEDFNQKKSLWSYKTIIENYEEGPVTCGVYTTEQNYSFGEVEFEEEKIIIKTSNKIFIKMISKLFTYKDFEKNKIFFYLNNLQLASEELIENCYKNFDKIEIFC